ncbi:DUF4942 domain-containing protein [Pontibacter sp. BT731]|uniref:DUF4942 domain-containing protein n=1 Tax=Pontibacter coccineus TaxID=3063328 RepID=UPI0026E1C40D|nr:DUF4942 domain-containing protein [Pontibacter sp. BT731]MDO6389008.1 DUF4942 domain-containing protein [Pontibacter sp. BT731]
MFHEEFYPTPAHVIEKMIDPIRNKLVGKSILEPSAGKGDILDYLVSSNRVSKKRLYAIEQSQELQFVLQKKEYKVIDSDFLQYKGDYHFDFIIGNPPFSNGDAHLLKAWEILESGHIVFLLNAETILNPFTKTRQLLKKLIEDHGSFEVLGNVFQAAERKTGVNVALVRLEKKTVSRFEFDLNNKGTEKAFSFDEESIKNPIARQDAVGNLLIQYDNLKESYTEYLKAREKLKFYSQGLFEGTNTIERTIDGIQGENSADRYNAFCDDSKMVVWRMIIQKLGIERYMTKSVQENFSKFTQSQGALNLNKENIQQLVNMLLENGNNILEQAVIDVFDLFTSYFKENRLHVEGWKTNDRWKVNKKVILPNFVSSAWSAYYSTSHYRYSQYGDIDKVMCYLSGKRYEDLGEGALDRSIHNVKVGDSGLYESEFFYFRCYKKGTLHITFKSDFLWQEFNMRATAGKQWLPESERKAWQESKQQYKMIA